MRLSQPELKISAEPFYNHIKYLIKSFLYIFFSVNGGETRLFPLRAAAHSGKKAGFLSRANIEDLWLGTYVLTGGRLLFPE
ncbi:Uncharacterized protein dnm_027910 [Desulfonema magnum]|uniref:Uncharacterized protein n=1 Tax=Desulfonema magnum TaxID=45655 RepID=A0A975BJK5_9BACT|nr:Uncharacterized protein dnm_027910 [Desulfonema magnum]